MFSEHIGILEITFEGSFVFPKLKVIAEDITLTLLNQNTTKSSYLNNFHSDRINIGLFMVS